MTEFSIFKYWRQGLRFKLQRIKEFYLCIKRINFNKFKNKKNREDKGDCLTENKCLFEGPPLEFVFIELPDISLCFLNFLLPTDICILSQANHKFRDFLGGLSAHSDIIEKWWFRNCALWLLSFPSLSYPEVPPWDPPLPSNLLRLQEPSKKRLRIRSGSIYEVKEKIVPKPQGAEGLSDLSETWAACFRRIHSWIFRNAAKEERLRKRSFHLGNEIWDSSEYSMAIKILAEDCHNSWNQPPMPSSSFLNHSAPPYIPDEPTQSIIGFDIFRRKECKENLTVQNILQVVSELMCLDSGENVANLKLGRTKQINCDRETLRKMFIPISEGKPNYQICCQPDPTLTKRYSTVMLLLCIGALLSSNAICSVICGTSKELSPCEVLNLASVVGQMILSFISEPTSRNCKVYSFIEQIQNLTMLWKKMLKENKYQDKKKRHRITFAPVLKYRFEFTLLTEHLVTAFQTLLAGGSLYPSDSNNSISENSISQLEQRHVAGDLFAFFANPLASSVAISTSRIEPDFKTVMFLFTWALRRGAVLFVRNHLFFGAAEEAETKSALLLTEDPSTLNTTKLNSKNIATEYQIQYCSEWVKQIVRVVVGTDFCYVFQYFMPPEPKPVIENLTS